MENYEPNTIDEYFDLLSEVEGLDVHLNQKSNGHKEIQVNSPNPKQTRNELRWEIGPELGIDFQ